MRAAFLFSVILSTTTTVVAGEFDTFIWYSTEIAGELHEKAAIIVPVTSQGTTRKMYAQLDTGSDATMLYGNILRKLGVPVDSANNETPHFRWYGHNDSSGALEKPMFIDWNMDWEVDTLSDNPEGYVIGTIGLDKVIGKILILDFPHNRYTVLSDTTELDNTSLSNINYIDAVIEHNKFLVDVLLGEDTIPAVTYDCGSSSTVLNLPLSLWQVATGRKCDDPAVKKDSVRSWGEYLPIYRAPAKSDMLFGSIHLQKPIITTVVWSDSSLAGIKLLGNAPFYDSLVVIVDCIRVQFGISTGHSNKRP